MSHLHQPTLETLSDGLAGHIHLIPNLEHLCNVKLLSRGVGLHMVLACQLRGWLAWKEAHWFVKCHGR